VNVKLNINLVVSVRILTHKVSISDAPITDN